MGNISSVTLLPASLDSSLLEDQEWLSILENEIFDDLFLMILRLALKSGKSTTSESTWYDRKLGIIKRDKEALTNRKQRENRLDDLMIGIVVRTFSHVVSMFIMVNTEPRIVHVAGF